MERIERDKYDKYEDAALRSLPGSIEQADKGVYNAKRRLLQLFCKQVDAGEPLYPKLLAYLARHFRDALEAPNGSKGLAKALLGGPTNRPPDPELTYRDQVFAMEVQILVQKKKLVTESIGLVVAKYDSQEDIVKRAWQKYRKSLLLKDWLPPKG